MDSRDWLHERTRLTGELYKHPYDLELYLKRAITYEHLGFSDLAAGDAYRALLLTDEAQDDSGEYHRYALEAMRSRLLAHGQNYAPKSSDEVIGDITNSTKERPLVPEENRGFSRRVEDGELRSHSQ
ncbi:MAG: hypothetical protein M1830_007655, partial [Pleopsidium flavum]